MFTLQPWPTLVGNLSLCLIRMCKDSKAYRCFLLYIYVNDILTLCEHVPFLMFWVSFM